jgi:DNA repair exonuclease SbcCD ATPase subunit
MTIKIKNLTVKNFMSVGNQTQAVDFGREQLTLVLGENLDQGGDDSGSRNGTGKTTIVNALSFALFGTALTNIKKDNLINKINSKNMLVTLTFDKDGNNYKIERGRKPAVMKFYVNDQEKTAGDADDSQGDMRETQKDIHELLGMTHDMFKHVVALNTYTEPFLSLKANEQREIIEQLLGITLLSEKAESLKEQIRQTKDAIVQESADIEAAKKANDKIQLSITGLETRQSAWYAQQKTDCAKIAQSIIELQSVDIEKELEQHAKLKAYDEHAAKIKSLNKEKATLENAVVQAEKSQTKYAKELESLAKKKCHACEQELHDHKHTELTAAAKKNVEDATVYFSKVADDYEKVVSELEAIGDIDNGRKQAVHDSGAKLVADTGSESRTDLVGEHPG